MFHHTRLKLFDVRHPTFGGGSTSTLFKGLKWAGVFFIIKSMLGG
jgi:hypothetical protein